MDRTEKKCTPCKKGTPPLDAASAQKHLSLLAGWVLRDRQIEKEFHFPNFVAALKFVNLVGEIAEKEQHHPDLFLYQWNRVRVSSWTHTANGLTENDFILAAKIDKSL